MPQVSLERPRIDAVIRKLIAAGMAEHVGVRLDAEICDDRRPLDHAGEARRRQRRTALGNDTKGDLALSLCAAAARATRGRSAGACLGCRS